MLAIEKKLRGVQAVVANQFQQAIREKGWSHSNMRFQ